MRYERMNAKTLLKTVVFAVLAFCCGAEASIIFQIGLPDGSAWGFGLSHMSYHNYLNLYPKPIVFDAEKDKSGDWPFIHPNTLDKWAGSRKIIFSYRKGGTDNFDLYEIGVDGQDIKQITSGKYDDIEPTYLADGKIMPVILR